MSDGPRAAWKFRLKPRMQVNEIYQTGSGLYGNCRREVHF
jgi:hypothetical protein